VAPLLSRATHPERVRANLRISVTPVASQKRHFGSCGARNCRAADSQIRLGALPPAPAPLTPEHPCGTLLVGRCDYVGTLPPPSRRLQIASHCSALVAATGAPAAPGDDLVLRERTKRDSYDGRI